MVSPLISPGAFLGAIMSHEEALNCILNSSYYTLDNEDPTICYFYFETHCNWTTIIARKTNGNGTNGKFHYEILAVEVGNLTANT